MYRKILIVVLTGFLLMASSKSQPRTYAVNILGISQPDGRPPVSEGLAMVGDRYVTFSGAPLVIEVAASGFECPHQDISFIFSYLYRRVRPANFLEDPSLFVMEGYTTTTTIASENCVGIWTSPLMQDGIHTVGILAFDGSGAQSPWHYITIIKNNERDGDVGFFPGGDQDSAIKSEEAPISQNPDVIIDTPSQLLRIGKDPVQYVDIHFHTNYPFPVEYFYVEWYFLSASDCEYSSYAIIYPSGFNEGMFHLDMSTVFATGWDEPSDDYGKCLYGPGEFEIKVSAKIALGLGSPSTVYIRIA